VFGWNSCKENHPSTDNEIEGMMRITNNHLIIPMFVFLAVLAPMNTARGQDSGSSVVRPTVEPNGFRSIVLGMDMDSVKKLLKTDSLFNYRGEPDVLFTPNRKQSIIECSGNSFVSRAYFQFNEGKLFIITIVLNEKILDYYTMFTTLSKKYGESTALNPEEAVWVFRSTRMSLEKPLRVKYIAIDVFARLKNAGMAEERVQDLTRMKFLEEF
jgi:hypothetical protein